MQKRVREVVEGTARAYGAKAELTYTTGYPVLVNEERKTAFAASVAREVAGKDKVNTECAPLMGAEDFAFMLQERPGAFIYIGNGNSAQLQNPAYDFNDEAIPAGTSYWVRLAETALAGDAFQPLLRHFHAVLGRKLGSSAMSRWHGGR